MTNERTGPDRRTVLRTGAGTLAALGAGCFSFRPPGASQNESRNETPNNETVPDVAPEEDGELELVFEDWFEENSVDAGVWETEFPWGERIHNFNAYASPANAYVYDNKLVLKAIEQQWEVPGGTAEKTEANGDGASNATGNGTGNTTGNRTEESARREPVAEETTTPTPEERNVVPYTTGVATPYRSFSPGYIEGRIRVPPIVEGFWPAFWLTPDDQWPPEIDIFEFFGSDPCLYMTYYYRDSSGHIQYDEGVHCGPDFSADFHEYAIDWREDRIVWYIDGTERFRFENGDYISTDEMRLILNFGVDASFVGTPSSDDLPAYMEIDRVRVWER